MTTFKKNKDADLYTAGLSTQLVHSPMVDASGFKSQHTPVYRGSSTFFKSTADQRAPVDGLSLDYSYGLHGNPTQYTLCKKLAEIEDADYALVCPSGLSAITVLTMAHLKSGDHWLIPENVYGPVESFAAAMQKDYGLQYSVYNPMDLPALEGLILPNTKMIWTEAPGSLTFEVPDLKAIVDIAKKFHLLTAIDNTWSAGLTLKPFDLGIDLSIQALTKYQCGHADVLMGAVLGKSEKAFRPVERQNRLMGLGVSSSDCELVLRGLLTLPVRYKAQAATAINIASALQAHPAVHRVLHPALPDCPGHEHYKTLFSGSASLFAVQLKENFSDEQACKWVDSLKWFKIAYSWGGPESLAGVVNIPDSRRDTLNSLLPGGGPIVRLAIGLEDEADLLADLIEQLNHATS